MQHILPAFIWLLLMGCSNANQQKQFVQNTNDTLLKTVANRQESDWEKHDSIRLSKALQLALDYATDKKYQNGFGHEFKSTPDDSSFTISTQMLYGHLFAPNQQHLLVRQIVPYGAVCTVFLLNGNDFNNILEKEVYGMGYISDTLRDINGDSYKDFLIHSYAPAGCCLRHLYNVFLYQPQSSHFSNDYEFMNPTFFPQEKTIRGLEYGHLGEAGLYTYRWKGLQIDTVEYIYTDALHKGRFIKTKQSAYKPTEKAGVVLNALPKVYRSVEGANWFLDY